jgi:Na+/proline symporter
VSNSIPIAFFGVLIFAVGFYAATHSRKDKQNHYTLKGKSVLVAFIVFFLCFGGLVFVTFPTAEVQLSMKANAVGRAFGKELGIDQRS